MSGELINLEGPSFKANSSQGWRAGLVIRTGELQVFMK